MNFTLTLAAKDLVVIQYGKLCKTLHPDIWNVCVDNMRIYLESLPEDKLAEILGNRYGDYHR